MSSQEGSARPAWEIRREIASFGLTAEQTDDIIARARHAVVSWVTKANEPVQAVMVYVVIDGLITVTSTTNRAKYHSWRRNPAASFCILDPDDPGRQVTLRGHIEILQDDELLARWTEGFLEKVMGRPPRPDQIARELAKFAAPDRHMMRLHVDRTVSHDLPGLLEAERQG